MIAVRNESALLRLPAAKAFHAKDAKGAKDAKESVDQKGHSLRLSFASLLLPFASFASIAFPTPTARGAQ
jgi:hypothetical protein